MAINKKLIHFNNFSTFNSKKLSANVENTQYTIGIEGEIQSGAPDILYQSICYIKDTKQQWTHGQLYDGSKSDILLNETDPVFSASPAASITDNKIEEWNNKVDKVNGKQLSTEDFTTALKNKLNGLSNYDDTELSEAIEALRGDFDNIVSGDTTTAIKTFNEIIAFLDGLTDTQDLESIIASIEQQIAGKMDKMTLAKVATSGNYNDLSNKPTIPSAVTESTVSGWGFTKNTGTYNKPSGGIPKSDLALTVQTSLGKADTALQSYTEQYKGTVTGVKVNGTTKNPSNGVVDLGTVITAHQTLKTINGQSLIGSGDIVISGGGSSDANIQAVDTGDIIDDVTVNYATKTYVDGLVGDINSILESIINGEVYGESKPINYGHIQSTNGNIYTLQFDLPVTSTLQIDYGDVNFTVNEGNKVANSYTLGPGESIGNTATVSPDEDATYIYKIIIE